LCLSVVSAVSVSVVNVVSMSAVSVMSVSVVSVSVVSVSEVSAVSQQHCASSRAVHFKYIFTEVKYILNRCQRFFLRILIKLKHVTDVIQIPKMFN
jgi:hypothetical protein